MPRRRISARSLGLFIWSNSSIAFHGSQNAPSAVDLFAQRRRYPRAERQIQVHPRPEANEPEPLAARQVVAGLNVAQDPTCNQTRDLDAGEILPVRALEPEGVAL